MLLGLVSVVSAAAQPALSVAVKGGNAIFETADKPFIKANKVFLSAKAIATQLGFTTTQKDSTYTIVNGAATVKYTVGKRVFYINDRPYVLPKAVRLKNNVPFISEEFFRVALGEMVTYTEKTNVVSIGAANVAPASPLPAPAPPVVVAKPAPTKLILATTTSTKDSGFLDVFIPKFEAKYNVKVVVNSVGTGDALKMAAMGNADVVLTHSATSEAPYLEKNGTGSNNVLIGYKRVMWNDFILVGPAVDPAHVKDLAVSDTNHDGTISATEAFAAIYNNNSPSYQFITRGDASGTASKELGIWAKLKQSDGTTSVFASSMTSTSATDPNSALNKPVKLFNSYVISGAAMGNCLILANNSVAYCLTDRGTWLNYRKNPLVKGLVIVNEGDLTNYQNIYHVSQVDPAKFPAGQINTTDAQKFSDYLLSSEGQAIINNYKIDGENVFTWFPDPS